MPNSSLSSFSSSSTNPSTLLINELNDGYSPASEVDIRVQENRAETKKIFKALKESTDKLVELHLTDGLESPYVFQDMLTPLNPQSFHNNKYKEETEHETSSLNKFNEIYDLIICLAGRFAEFATRLSILIKMFLFLMGLIELLIFRINQLERQNQEMESLKGRLEKLETTQVSYETDVNGNKGTNDQKQVDWEALDRDLEEIENQHSSKYPPTPPRSISTKSSKLNNGKAKTQVNKTENVTPRRSVRTPRSSKPVNYAELTSESE